MAQANTGDIIAPQNDPHTPRRRLAGRDLHLRCSRVLDRHAGAVLQAGRRASAGRLHPVHRQDRADRAKFRSGTSKRFASIFRSGLSVNPQATAQCELGPGERPDCENLPGGLESRHQHRDCRQPADWVVAHPGARRRLQPRPERRSSRPASALSILGNDVYLEAGIAWEGDYHEHFTIDVAKLSLPVELGLGDSARILKNRLVFDGRAGDGTFITTPTTCFDPAVPPFEHVYSTYLRADSYEMPGPELPRRVRASGESPLPPGEKPLECGSIPFEPSIAVDPNTAQTDSPAGAAVNRQPAGDQRSRQRGETGHLPCRGRARDPAARDGPQPVGGQRARGLHRRPVRQGDQGPGRLPCRFESRHRRGPDPAAAAGFAERRRLSSDSSSVAIPPPATRSASSSTSSRPATGSPPA